MRDPSNLQRSRWSDLDRYDRMGELATVARLESEGALPLMVEGHSSSRPAESRPESASWPTRSESMANARVSRALEGEDEGKDRLDVGWMGAHTRSSPWQPPFAPQRR